MKINHRRPDVPVSEQLLHCADVVAVFNGVGMKPFAVGTAGALAVGSVGMLTAVIFGRFVHL